jgi:glyceraldehyde 3-phosphate dehydrogenase
VCRRDPVRTDEVGDRPRRRLRGQPHRGEPRIISCASCTTYCITSVIEIAHRRIGVERAVMTAVDAYTATQRLVDSPSTSFRHGRAAAANLVPASIGAARATTRALPELTGRFDGVALHAPIPVGSIANPRLRRQPGDHR